MLNKAFRCWQSKSCTEPKNQDLYRANLNSDQVPRVYLEDFSDTSTESLGIGMMQLIVLDTVDAIASDRPANAARLTGHCGALVLAMAVQSSD